MSTSRYVFVSTSSVYYWCMGIFDLGVALFVAPFVAVHGMSAIRMRPLHLVAALLLLVGHELLHVVGFRAAGGVARDAISLRMSWRHLMPHVDLRAPVTARRARIAALLPGVVTGLLPLLAGALTGDGRLMFMGFLLTVAAGGDVAVVAALQGLPPTTEVELGANWARQS